MGRIWYQKKDLEKLEVRGWFIKSTDAFTRSYERFSCPSGVYLVFKFDSNLKNGVAVFRRPLIKAFFLCALRKTANKFVGGLPKPESNLTCIVYFKAQ